MEQVLKGRRSETLGREKDLKSLNFRSYSLDPIPPSQKSYGSIGEGKVEEG